MDNGPKFVSKPWDRWAHTHGATLVFIQLGKPTDNCFIESLNGRFRNKFLGTNLSPSRAEARKNLEEDGMTIAPFALTAHLAK